MRSLCFLLLALLLPLSAQAAPNPYQKIEACRWNADRWNDGDSFHVITGDAGKEIVARLYFVDTPEAETAYRDRLDEQAAYWRITREQAKDIAHEAAAFTAKRLAEPQGNRIKRGGGIMAIIKCTFRKKAGRSLGCPKPTASANTSSNSKIRASHAASAIAFTTS